jgi:hypothetical protein
MRWTALSSSTGGADLPAPLMVLNSRGDPICSGQNVDDNADAIAGLEDGILVMTSRGSHCAHFDGWSGQCWAHNLMVEYLAANDAVLKRNNGID